MAQDFEIVQEGTDIVCIDMPSLLRTKRICYQGNIYANRSKEAWEKMASAVKKAMNAKPFKDELDDALKGAGQYCVATHIGKHVHPNCTFNAYAAHGTDLQQKRVYADSVSVLPNGAVTNGKWMPTLKFLFNTFMSDGRTIYESFEQDSVLLQTEIADAGYVYSDIRAQLFVPKPKNGVVYSKDDKSRFVDINNAEGKTTKSDWKLSQVFFPTEKGYHLLSVIPDASVLFEMRDRIDHMRMQVFNKEENARAIASLTLTKFGGSKPQNIGMLNSEHSGMAYMLPAFPPIDKREYRTMKGSFFGKLYLSNLEKQLQTIYDLQEKRKGSSNVKKVFMDIVSDIVFVAGIMRDREAGWAKELDSFVQKIWLDKVYEKEYDKGEWRSAIAQQIVEWIMGKYIAYAEKRETKSSAIIDLDVSALKAKVERIL